MENNFMEKCLGLLGDSSLFFVAKGQLRNIQRKYKDTGEYYYVADLRALRNISVESVYQTSFNIFNICFDSAFCKENNISDDDLIALKNNEIIVSLAVNSVIKKYKNNDKEYKLNNVSFFVNDYMLLNTIDAPKRNDYKNVVNL